jgi:hypothetical protein
MANKKMTTEQLERWLLENPMTAYNTTGVKPTSDDVIGTKITDPKAQYIAKEGTKWLLKFNKIPTLKRFPSDWLDHTAKSLAAKLIISMLILFFSVSASAQLTIDLGTVKTADKNTAVNVGISYFRSLDSIWKTKDLSIIGKHSIFSFNPQFDIRFGTQDAFSSIQGKLVGSFMSFKTKDFEGFTSPDFSRTVNVYPVAIGVESNSSFTTYNGIFEAGYTPYNPNSGLLKYSTFGIWLQGGYKFRGDSVATQLTGGAKDQSYEAVRSGIMRVKSSLGVDTKGIVNAQGVNLGFSGKADVWYDVVNQKFYHKLDAIATFYLSNGAWINAVYSKGAGAPTFNNSDQYGVGFKVQL